MTIMVAPPLSRLCVACGKSLALSMPTEAKSIPAVAARLAQKRLFRHENLSPVIEVANRNKVPVVSMSKQGVENGALAALYADTYDLGRQAAELAARIIRGDVDPREAGFQYARHADIIINLTSAKALQYQFPPHVLGKAAIVIR